MIFNINSVSFIQIKLKLNPKWRAKNDKIVVLLFLRVKFFDDLITKNALDSKCFFT